MSAQICTAAEWDAGGAANRDWSTAANWTADTEPTSTDDAYINGSYTGVVSIAGERTLSLYVGSTNQPSNGANSTGRVEQTGGDLIVGESMHLGKYAGGFGHYFMTAGSLTISNQLQVGDQGLGSMVITNTSSVTVDGYLIVGLAGSGVEAPGSRLTMGGGTLAVNGLNLQVGGQNSADAGADGLLEQFGGTITANQLKIADNPDSTGRVAIAGGTFSPGGFVIIAENGRGIMNVSGNSTTTVAGVTYVSYYSASRGFLSVSGGLFAANGGLEVGYNANQNASGLVTVAGGNLISSDIVIGRQGTGTVSIASGSVTAQTLAVSYAPNGVGRMHVSGGRLVLTGTGENISLRRRGGVIDISGGTVQANGIAVGSILAHNTQTEPAALNLSGGILSGGFDNDTDTANDFYIGSNGNTGIVTVSGSGILDLSRSNNDLILGEEANGQGIVQMSGGTIDVGGSVLIGNDSAAGSEGRFIISGGTLTNAGTLTIGHATGGSGRLEVAGGSPAVRVGNLTINAQGELRSRLNGTAISPIRVAGTITAGGTLSITNTGAYTSGTYLIATSLSETAVSGTFSAINWLNGITGTVSYANNRILVSFTVPPAGISGQVRYDSDGDGDVNDADTGIERVRVILYTDPNSDGDPSDGSAVATNLTDSSGSFSFTGLSSGSYVVEETDNPGYQSTADTQGANDNRIAVVLSGVDSTGNVFLDTYEVLDKTVDKTEADVGETLTYTITPFYAGNSSLINIQVKDPVPTGTTYVASSANAGGAYAGGIVTWSFGSAASGKPGNLSSNGATTLVTSGDARLEDGKNANNNYGGDSELKVKDVSKVSLITFNLSSIPANATINSAWLQVSVKDSGDGLNVFRMTTDWTESGVTWNKRDGSADWAGGAFSSSDYNTTALTTINASSTGLRSNNIASAVQGWVQGTYSNKGVALIHVSGGGDEVKMDSKENGDASKNPRLIVNWSVAGTGNSMDIVPNLVGGTGEVKVVMSLTSPAPLTNVTPFIAATNATGGVTATFVSGPSPASANVHTNPVTFTYYYNVASGTSTGRLSFTGGATVSGGTFSNAVSDEIMVVAPLQFQALVSNPPGRSFVTNRAILTDSAGLPDYYSGIPTTRLFSVISGQVRNDADGDGDLGDADSGITNVTVVLHTDPNGDGNPADGIAIATNVTDGSGNYSFGRVATGTYVLVETDLAGYQSTADSQGANDNRIAITNLIIQLLTNHVFLDTKPATISGQVRDDADGDGDLGDADAGIENVTVVLFTDPNGDGNPADGTAIATNVTDVSGNYSFPSNAPASYVLQQYNLSGYLDSADSQGANDNRIALTLISATDSTNNVFLDMKVAAISGQVRDDVDGDGDFGDADSGITNVTIVLHSDPNGDGNPADGVALATNITDSSGSYSFPSNLPGHYVIIETDPTNFLSSADSVGANDNQIALLVISGSTSNGLVFLDTRRATISGYVLHDTDGDGNLADADSGITNVTVVLYTDPNGDGDRSDGTPVATNKTDAAGYYNLGFFTTGDYVVVETDPAGYVSTADSDAPNDNEISVTLPGGQHSVSNNFLDTRLVSISGQVRHDVDGDGNLGDGDLGISAVTIELWTDPNADGNPADGSLVSNVVTDALGDYTFVNIFPGSYVVVETDLAGYNSTADSQGANDNRIAITLSSGGNSTGNDFLDSQLVSISGQVRHDTDADGSFADADLGITNVTIVLWTDPNGDGNPADGAAIRTNKTDSSGNYIFSGVLAGTYVVVETDPAGYQSTADTQGANDNRIAVTLSSVLNSTGNNFLDTKPVTISGQVREDFDYDGNPNDPDPGLAGATVVLFTDPNRDGDPADGTAVGTNVTTSTGYFSFTNRLAGGYVLYEVNPPGYDSTGDSVGANDDLIPRILSSGTVSTNNIFLDVSAYDIDLPGVQSNMETIVAGSWIIPMDNSKQNIGSAFNLKAYGLLASLLHSNIPVKWVIRTGKVKDAKDFTAYAQRIYPSSTAASNSDFLAGPFIIPKIFTNQAAGVIAAYGNNVAVYKLLSNITVDVRYTINTRPVAAPLNDGGTIAIHVSALEAAGFVEGVSYFQTYAYSTNPINTNACYSFSSEPHFHSDDPSLQAEAIQAFLNSRGNFLAQCAGLHTYENHWTHGHYQTSLGIEDKDDVSTYTYPNADMPFVQFQGAISDEGGSVHEYSLSNNSTFVNSAFIQVQGIENTNTYRATQAKMIRGQSGGNIFYLGGHDYNGTAIGDINGRRMYMNAVFVPSLRPEDCGLRFGADLAITKTDNANFAIAGTTNVYTIVVTNMGPDSVLGARVIDVFPENFTNAVWSAVGTGGSVVPNGTGSGDISELVDLPRGGSVIFSVTGLVQASSSCILSNVALVAVPENVVEIDTDNNRAYDVSITYAINIGGQVREDIDGDGDIADADPGITNVTVILYTDPNGDGDPADGAIVSNLVTDSSGSFFFANIITGRYVIEETDLSDYLSTADSDGTNDNRISFNIECGVTPDSTNNVFLDTTLSTITGFVGDDSDADGNLFDGDPGITNVTVVLWTDPNGDGDPSDGTAVDTNVTDAAGTFTFIGVSTGRFVIVETDPAGYQSTADSQGINDNEIAINLLGGQSSSGHIFLDTLPVNVSGQVRDDADGDADLGDADSGISGVTIVLFTDPNGDGNRADGTAVATNVTDGSGNYTFTNIIAGTYVIEETDLAAYISTADSQGANDNSIAITVLSPTDNTGNDFLDTRPQDISGQVRNDIDGDGDLSDPDAGLANITIRLFTDPNRDGNPADGVAIITNVTDGSGNYSFTNITPGYYVIVETDPANFQSSNDKDGGNFNQIVLAHLSGINSVDNDFLDTQVALISGYVREDLDGDADLGDPDPAITNVTIILYSDPNGDGDPVDGTALETNVTDSTGFYQFPFYNPGNYVIVETDLAGYESSTDSDGTNDNRIAVYLPGSYNSTNNVFLDLRRADISGQVRNDVDGDGDLGDPDSGLAGATVRLFTDPNRDGDPADGEAIATNVTTASGAYAFTNVYPGYYVIVETDPAGYQSTADNNPPNDNRVVLGPHQSGVASTGIFLDSDRAAIRGQVRNDIDGDGDFADPDVGIENVFMTLYTDPNNDGDPSDGSLVTTTLTDVNGYYVFTAIAPGNYVVVETDPDGYTSTADTDPPIDDNWIGVTLPGGVDSNGHNYLDDPDRVFKTVNQTNAYAGDTLTYSISTFYAGNQALTNVVLTDKVPVGTTYSPGSVNAGGTYTNGVVTWLLGSTAPGTPGVTYSNFAGSISPSGDTFIESGKNDNNNYGTDNRLKVDEDKKFSLIMFNLSSIPTNASINAAWLRTEVETGGTAVNIHSATTTWTENGATFKKRDGINNWAAGDFSSSDYNGSVVSTISSSTTGVKSNNVLSAVQNWVQGVSSNRGFVLKTDGSSNDETKFYSNNEGTASRRPALYVAWSIGGTSNTLDIVPSLISGTSAVQVIMTLSSPTLLTNVTPRPLLATNTTGGVTATLLSGPTPASANVHTDAVHFTYVYNVVAGTNAGSLRFTGGATAPNGTFANAVSDRIIVSPLLTFNADVEIVPTVSYVTNVASLFETNFIPSTNSNLAITRLRSAIRGQVREDLDGDGNLADTDPGLTNVTLTLFTDPNGDGDPSDGTAIETNVTDSAGDYLFENVFTGRFVIVETDPANSISTADSAGANDNRIAVYIPVLSLSYSNDFLDTFPVSISGDVRDDADADGNPADPDIGLSNVTVELFTDPNGDGDPADGSVVDTRVTDGSGNYIFTNVIAGNYVVVETDPAAYHITGDADGNVLGEIALTLTSRVSSAGNYFLVSRLASISGFVLEDLDGDGDLAEADPALTNITVVLYTDPNCDGNVSDGAAIATNFTDSSGNYLFGSLDTGCYVVVETDRTGFISITDSDPPNDNQIAVNMPGGLNSVSNIFLDAVLTEIYGQVREDVDGDGNVGDADSGLAGAKIELYTDPNGDGNRVDGSLISSLITTASGLFSFTNLLPGYYILIETNPAGYASTADTVGGNDDRIPRLMISRSVSTNNIFLDAQYGGIGITKESSFPGEVVPGEIITYTITVTNGGVVAQSGTTVIDNLPIEMSYVADSTLIVNSIDNVRDEFNAVAYTNNDGSINWSSDWIEEGETDGADAGKLMVVDGELRVSEKDRMLTRSMDLSAYNYADNLTFDYRIESFDDANDYMYFYASSNGGVHWVQLYLWTGPIALETGTLTFAMDPFISSNTTIRFATSPNMKGDDLGYFDDFNLEVQTRIAGGAPPTLLAGYTIDAGEKLTITFDAVAEASIVLVNEACVTTVFESNPYCAYASNLVTQLLLTQGLVNVIDTNEAWHLRWSATGDPITRDYDVIFVDDAPIGFYPALTNQWNLAARVQDREFEDLGGTNHPPAWGMGEDIRFYRAAHRDRWINTNVTRNASIQIYAAKAIQLNEGENFVSLFMIPDYCNPSYVFGTNILPSAPSMADSTKIEWYGATPTGQSTNTIWLDSVTKTWRFSSGGNANEFCMPLNEGFSIVLPPGSGSIPLPVIGQMPTNIAAELGTIQTLKGGDRYNVVSYNLPYRVKLGESGLREAGFTGVGPGEYFNPRFSDEIRIMQRGGGSLASPVIRVLMNAQGQFQYWQGGSGSAENYRFNVDDAIIIYTRKSTQDLEWTIPLPYPTPTHDMRP